MNKKITQYIELLQKDYSDVSIALFHENPFQLLIATILSAQCTDVLVNKVTPGLFKKYPTIQSFADANLSTLQQDLNRVTFYNNKSKYIIKSSQIILDKYDGKIPRTMKELVVLPGVARKTANVVLHTAFGVVEGVVVDTHVKRLAFRLKLTKQTDPVKVEKDLMKKLDKEYWGWISHAFIWHGRRVCKARRPLCDECRLKTVCPSAFKVKKK